MNCKPLARKKLNNDSKFAMFYISVISIALGASLYGNSLNGGWNRAVFTFPPEVQKVVENGTAIMEVWWRWTPETLEMIVKVNDDDYNETHNEGYSCDCLGLLFDSDHSGKLAKDSINGNDRGVFLYQNNLSIIGEHCFIYLSGEWGNNSVSPPLLSDGGLLPPIAENLNDTYCVFREGEGYTFKLTIPIEFINVHPPTPIHISFYDSEIGYLPPPYYYLYRQYDTIATDFEG